jgi:hypothetical protein
MANLIILIFKKGENVPNGVFFSFSEKQIHQVGKFHHKKQSLLIHLSFFFLLGIILVGIGIGNK